MNPHHRIILGLLVVVGVTAASASLLSGWMASTATPTTDHSLVGAYEAAITSLLSLLLTGILPTVMVALCVLCFLVVMSGESVIGGYEPLVEAGKPERDLAALRRVLRAVRDWLTRQQLTVTARPLLDSIATLSEEIASQLEGRGQNDVPAAAASLHKLLSVELATLVLRYQRVPLAQKLLPFLNTTANELLVNGLRAVDDQLRNVHEALASADLRELAVQTRYLELASENESRPAVVTNASKKHLSSLPAATSSPPRENLDKLVAAPKTDRDHG